MTRKIVYVWYRHDTFFPQYFWSKVGWSRTCRTHGYRNCPYFFLDVIFPQKLCLVLLSSSSQCMEALTLFKYFNHSPTDGLLAYFQSLTNTAAVNSLHMYLVHVSICLPKNGNLGAKCTYTVHLQILPSFPTQIISRFIPCFQSVTYARYCFPTALPSWSVVRLFIAVNRKGEKCIPL